MEYQPVVRSEDLESEIKEDYIPINEKLNRKIFTVDVIRSDEIQKSRMALPVFSEEHRIMEAIHHNDCVIICGETGSGKTTQVPQFLFESGYGSANSETPGLIGVTQPRRVAAVSMAERVGKELGNHGNKVGYQIRFDTKIGKETALKFMTDGVLLREMMTDFMLQKYSALIIDEAHERNVNTDILIGMLSLISVRIKLYLILHHQF
ncbi:unnamed protein product [[Candida] boidinii]|uniref:RNA helicase n=1 Tax=Candida boidinii TaxID=5477 RepID=A0A9W6T7E0_CANBO|nr:unnamed protein product [[Candida] boidinii]